ncbi:MAG: polyprenyl synthetase family protein [Opitutales bacterium]
MDFKTRLREYQERIEQGIDELLPPAEERPTRIHEAMRYSIQAGGKRLRPVLLIASSEMFTPRGNPLPAATAIECIHTYSLIHDDLPCMDDGELRRGKPTCHRHFDETTAVLAGDALNTYAFELLSRHYRADPALALDLIGFLSVAAGSRRLIGGQMEDILGERSDYTAEQLDFIHENKTAALIAAALQMGGRISVAEPADMQTLETIGKHLGTAFQIIDDILDATADTSTLGKTAGGDARAEKTTYLRIHGIEESRRRARRHTRSAIAGCREMKASTAFLEELILYLEHRLN